MTDTAPNRIEFYDVPYEEEVGHYATSFIVWYTPHEICIDFAAECEQPSDITDEVGEPTFLAECRVVARVRLPPGAVGVLLSRIAATMDEYEREWGPIVRPGERREPPIYPPDGGGEQ